VAVVNPNRQDDLSNLGHLAAVGLVFLTVVAVNRLLRARGWYTDGRAETDLLQWLDLVALGTVCDVVPLIGLNRAFVVKGLLAAARRGNPGLAALADIGRLGGPVAPYHLGFVIGPRINAGGRIGDAALGARLLASDDPVECERIAAELDRLNQDRQAIETATLEEAIAEAEAEIGAGPGPPVLLTGSQRWHAGVVGLIASRLKDRFHRPAFAIAFLANGTGSGSGRSIPGVDLGHAVREAVERGILAKGGGHAMAAGLTVDQSRLGELRAFLEESLGAAVAAAMDNRSISIDAALSASGATADLIAQIDRAGPFGAGHPEPVFAFPRHRIAFADTVGNGHLRLSLSTGSGATLKAMLFRGAGSPLGEAILQRRGQSLHFAGTLTLDQWQGNRRPSLRIIEAAEPVTA
jgi:single-stranded-DNA-specific exonuclease